MRSGIVCIILIALTIFLNLYLFYKNIVKFGDYMNEKDEEELFKILDLKDVWNCYRLMIENSKEFVDFKQLPSLLNNLKTAPIIKADIYKKGTQLKLLLVLKGGQSAIFKPQRYNITDVIGGEIYAGKDRFNAEIIAFYLSLIFDIHFVPPVVQRTIKIASDILPVATKRLTDTIYHLKASRYCVFGECFYCHRNEPVCEQNAVGINGALIYEVDYKFHKYPHPWHRTYNPDRKAQWQLDNNYCESFKSNLTVTRLLDLIDASIIDFLIQNGDRHHYEVFNDRVVLIDNGKGLRNTKVDNNDILAPLYQCCWIREKTWRILNKAKYNRLRSWLSSIPEVIEVVPDQFLEAIQKRVNIVVSVVSNCQQMKYF